jgi:hypothetical protein
MVHGCKRTHSKAASEALHVGPDRLLLPGLAMAIHRRAGNGKGVGPNLGPAFCQSPPLTLSSERVARLAARMRFSHRSRGVNATSSTGPVRDAESVCRARQILMSQPTVRWPMTSCLFMSRFIQRAQAKGGELRTSKGEAGMLPPPGMYMLPSASEPREATKRW